MKPRNELDYIVFPSAIQDMICNGKECGTLELLSIMIREFINGERFNAPNGFDIIASDFELFLAYDLSLKEINDE